MVEVKDIGKIVRCPRCGRKGRVRVVKQKNRKMVRGEERIYKYYYLAVRHEDGRYCVIKRLDFKIPESVDEVVKLIGELEEMRKQFSQLKEENEKMKEEIKELKIKNSMMEDDLSFYREVWKKSIVISGLMKEEEIVEKIKDLIRKGYNIRVLPFKKISVIKYGLDERL